MSPDQELIFASSPGRLSQVFLSHQTAKIPTSLGTAAMLQALSQDVQKPSSFWSGMDINFLDRFSKSTSTSKVREEMKIISVMYH